jgi:hypothetical protein
VVRWAVKRRAPRRDPNTPDSPWPRPSPTASRGRWSRGTRFTARTGTQVTDPFVIPRGDGTWLMVYKQQTRR